MTVLLEMINDDIIKTIKCGEHNNQPQIAAGVKDILYDAHNFNLAVIKKVLFTIPLNCNELASNFLFVCFLHADFYHFSWPDHPAYESSTSLRTLPRIAKMVRGTCPTVGGWGANLGYVYTHYNMIMHSLVWQSIDLLYWTRYQIIIS